MGRSLGPCATAGPGIAPSCLHGAREIEGQFGIWGEFLHGRTLATIVKEDGPLSADETLVVAEAICRALAAAHRAGLLHRDVKAQNVIRDRGGRIPTPPGVHSGRAAWWSSRGREA